MLPKMNKRNQETKKWFIFRLLKMRTKNYDKKSNEQAKNIFYNLPQSSQTFSVILSWPFGMQ